MSKERLNPQVDTICVDGVNFTYEDIIFKIRCYSSILGLLETVEHYEDKLLQNTFYIISFEIERYCDYLQRYA